MTTQGETVVELYYGADSQRPFTGISVKKYVNGVIERKCEFKDGLQNGLRQEWYATGIQRAATSYENSLRHGPEKRWYPNGQLGFEGGYWRGRRDGQITEWHENGQLRLKAFYRGARQDELRQAWHDNPAQEVLAQYLLTGIPEGVFTWWYPNGQKEIEGEISPDGKLLKLDRWRPNGKEERVDPELLETRTTEETRKTRWFLHGNPALPLTPDAEPSEMGKGIGRGLLDRAVAMCRRAKPDVMELEVHSSPWAVPVYGRLGFSATGPEQQACGMRFTRMVKRLEPQSGQLRRAEGARG
jgi:antitoxin component YwqK of YwqJK toxin-antitoxin module